MDLKMLKEDSYLTKREKVISSCMTGIMKAFQWFLHLKEKKREKKRKKKYFFSAEWLWIASYYNTLAGKKAKIIIQADSLAISISFSLYSQELHSQNPQVMMMKNPWSPKYTTPMWSANINACITFMQLSIYVQVSRFFQPHIPFYTVLHICTINTTFTRQFNWIFPYLAKLHYHSALCCLPELMYLILALPQFQWPVSALDMVVMLLY